MNRLFALAQFAALLLLPMNLPAEPDWRAESARRIETIRKGDFTLRNTRPG